MLRRLGSRVLLPHAAAASALRRGCPHLAPAAAAAAAEAAAAATATISSSGDADAAAVSSSSSSVAKARYFVDVLLAAIDHEAAQGYCDTQGQDHTFSCFASATLREVEQALPEAAAAAAAAAAASHAPEPASGGGGAGGLLALQEQLQRATQRLDAYADLDLQARELLLQQLRADLLRQAGRVLFEGLGGGSAAAGPGPGPGDGGQSSSSASPALRQQQRLPGDVQQQQQQQECEEALPEQAVQQPGPLAAGAGAPPAQQQQQLRPLQPRFGGPPLPLLRPQPSRPCSPAGQQGPVGPTPATLPEPVGQQPPTQHQGQQQPPTVQQQQQPPVAPHSHLLPGPAGHPPAAPHMRQPQQPATASSSSSSSSFAAPVSLGRSSSSPLPIRSPPRVVQGPHPPRPHMPYPTHVQQRVQQQQLQHPSHQQQQQQQMLPAWQLYFPLPEVLGGPPGGGAADTTGTPGAAAAAAAPAAAEAAAETSDDEAGAEASGSGDSSSTTTKRQESSRRSEAAWQAFLAAALAARDQDRAKQEHREQEAAGELKQRSGAWLKLREGRLTGSALANMLCWFGRDRGDQLRLWREKLKLQPPPPPNEKMVYGTRHEAAALGAYQRLAPHEALRDVGFAVWGGDDAHDWLAASPDGLITTPGTSGLAGRGVEAAPGGSLSVAAAAAAAAAAAGPSEEVAEWVRQQTGSSLEGVLEIKCPFKASPLAPEPHLPHRADAYYMPQVQVLCEVLDREWAVVYYWSEGLGSHMSLIHRDREYFALLWQAMADFWWRHVVPAKLALDAAPDSRQEVEESYAPGLHPYRDEIMRRSIAMVEAAPHRTFTAEQTRGSSGSSSSSRAALGAAPAATA